MRHILLVCSLSLLGVLIGFVFGALAVFHIWVPQPETSSTSMRAFHQTERPQAHTQAIHINGSRLYQLVQDWRTQEGLSRYTQDPYTCGQAEKRLEEIKTDWSHDGFWDEYCTECSLWGENLARQWATEQAVLDAWLASPEHATNLRNTEYTNSCIATDGYYTVHYFVAY